MTDAAPKIQRLHVAIFPSCDPQARACALIGGLQSTVTANTPKGGCWRDLPPTIHRLSDVPTLGEMPAPVLPVEVK